MGFTPFMSYRDGSVRGLLGTVDLKYSDIISQPTHSYHIRMIIIQSGTIPYHTPTENHQLSCYGSIRLWGLRCFNSIIVSMVEYIRNQTRHQYAHMNNNYSTILQYSMSSVVSFNLSTEYACYKLIYSCVSSSWE
jgi:hypothetical protein